MNVQAHMSGQISGQVPNQAGTQLPVLPQQNGNALSSQMQNLGAPSRHANTMDSEILRARTFMQEKIYEILQQRHQQPINEVKNIVKRLEEFLFRTAHTKEDYMNLDTLENRLQNLIKRTPMNNQKQQYPQQVNSSSPIGAMIPTPGMSHIGM